MAKYRLNGSELDKYCSILSNNSKICECSHRIPIPPNVDRVICNWCGHWVYRNDEIKAKYEEKSKRIEFKTKLKQAMNVFNKNNNTKVIV